MSWSAGSTDCLPKSHSTSAPSVGNRWLASAWGSPIWSCSHKAAGRMRRMGTPAPVKG